MRRFELAEGSSNKFWEITIDASSYSVRYGRIGTNGQTQTKSFDSPAAAETAAEKVISEKVKKGYLEVGAGAPPAVPLPAAAEADKTPAGAARAAAAEAPTAGSSATQEIFLVEGDAEAQRFWCGEAAGDTTRITAGKCGKDGRSTVTQHADAAKARAFVDAEAVKQRKKGFAPVSLEASEDAIAVLVVPKGVHAHEGARLLVNGKELLCALCGSDVHAAEVSSHRLPLTLLGTLAFPTVLGLGADLKRARILAGAVRDLPASSVWESKSLVGGKPRPAKKSSQLSTEDQLVATVFGRLLERTARGEGQLEVLKDLLVNAPLAEAVAAAGLLHGSNGGLRPVEVYNPALQPTPTWLWRLHQTADGQRESLADLSDRVALAKLMLEVGDSRGGALIDAVCWPLTKSTWDWLSVEDHDKGRRLLVQTGTQIAEGLNPAAKPLVISGVVDVQKWWSILHRAPLALRDHLVGALKRSPWPAGPASIVAWLNSNDYEAPGRARVIDALRDCGHPDKVTFAFSRAGTPDAASTAHWIPFDQAKGRLLNAEEWTAQRAAEPWPHRATCAALEAQGRSTVVGALRDLAWQVWSVTGRYIPRKDLDGSPLDDALLLQWRDELLAASAQATIAPIVAATSSAPDASAFHRDMARQREWHASLHRRAKELVAQLTPTRLGAAWVGALEPGPLGTRHRSAIFSHAILDALQGDVQKCVGDCSFQDKRSITQRLNAGVRLTTEAEAAQHAPQAAAWRADWECFRNVHDERLSVPFSFVLWDLESYLAEVEGETSPDRVERLIRLLALWDQELVSMSEYDSELRIPAIARHLVGDKELEFGRWPNWTEELFANGFPGWGLLRGVPPLEAEMLLRALFAPPFFDEREGVVRDALLGSDGLTSFRATPSFPVRRLFNDAAARTALLPTERAPRGSASASGAPKVEVRVLHVDFECSETRVGFRFSGPRASEQAEILVEHTESSYLGTAYALKQVREVATFRFTTLGVDEVMDHLLDMNDSAEEKVFGPALREAVSDATHSDGLVIEVRS